MLCSLFAPRPLPTVKHISFRKLKTLDLNAFKDDIARSDLFSDANPEKIVDLYNNKLRLRLDRHAPTTSKKVVFRPNIPWINNREFKHDVYGRRQTAKVTSDFLFFSRNH